MTIDVDDNTTGFEGGKIAQNVANETEDDESAPVLSVVLPTKNEEDGIAESIAQAKEAIAESGLSGEIIVSDSSTDRTPQITREMGATVISPDKPGYGYAYRYAFEKF